MNRIQGPDNVSQVTCKRPINSIFPGDHLQGNGNLWVSPESSLPSVFAIFFNGSHIPSSTVWWKKDICHLLVGLTDFRSSPVLQLSGT